MLSLTTDASGLAFGAVMGDYWFQGHFPPCDSKYVSIKELLPIVLTVGRWGPVSINQRVLFFSDKTAVGAVTNRQNASDPQLMCLVRQLVVACLSYNICFPARHIPGKFTVVANFISRFYLTRISRSARPVIPIQWLPWHATP